ncbi:Aste57867_5856 [Aphanomyces stellatus]|uniref:Aste57867_5856 protein n=1 Tax=Aphanomyces stellatus TaxID=120398 RepID=A0A485KDI1_9STRA|nr:hypothetical protein As57867_005842 [Aphanomyces stellatus]VFT82879.1 Aste57867_5856 [Aphanomyces stellatus]
MDVNMSLLDHLDILPLEDPSSSFDVVSMIFEDMDMFAPDGAVSTDSAAAASSSPLLPDPDRPKKINQSRKRQREELDYLRGKVGEMEQHLSSLRENKSPQQPSSGRSPPPSSECTTMTSPWESMAIFMRDAKQSALTENERLKQQLQEQIEFAKSLQALLQKRPQLTLFPTLIRGQWKVPRFVKDSAMRRAIVADVCEQMHHQLPAVLVESGLEGDPEAFQSYAPRLAKQNEELVLQVIICRREPVDFRVMGNLAWLLITGRLCIDRRNHCCLETFDANTVYVQNEGRWKGMVNQSKMIVKRHVDSDRVLLTARTILEDDKFPYEDDALVLNKCIWMLMEPDRRADGTIGTRLKFFTKSTLPMVQSTYVAQHLLDVDASKAESHQYYRVGNVTDATLVSLQEMVHDFACALFVMLEVVSGNTCPA